MQLREWNVWHCYSTYFLDELGDVQVIADRLMRTGAPTFVMSSDGLCWGRGKEGGIEEFHLRPVRERPTRSTTVHMPSSLSAYALESALQSSWMYNAESYSLEAPFDQQRYIRAFLPMCQLRYEHPATKNGPARTLEVLVYPQLKLYEDGVLLTELRVLGGAAPYTMDEFIAEGVNLFELGAQAFQVPPALFREYVRSTLSSTRNPILFRVSSVPYFRRLDRWLTENAVVDSAGAFEFELVGVEEFALDQWESDWGRWKGPRLLSRMIEQTVCGATRSVFGNSLRIGTSWRGRPSVYLLEFEGQPYDSRALDQNVRDELAKLMLRAPGLAGKIDASEILGPDLRYFGDYSVFMNEVLTLWVFGRKALTEESRAKNWPDLVYEHQVVVEWIEHRFAAHQQLRDVSALDHRSIADVATRAARLSRLEQAVSRASRYGEIKDLLSRADQCLKLDATRQEVRANLERKSMVIAEQREVHAQRLGWLLSVLLGVVGVPPLSEAVTKPLWQYFGFWKPVQPELQTPWLVLVTVIVLCIVALLVWRIASRQKAV
jgi:hypothetical protein